MSIAGCPPSGVELQTLCSRVIKAKHTITAARICSGLLVAHCLIAPNITKAPCWNERIIYLWVLCCVYVLMLQRRWILTLGTKVSIMALINSGKPFWDYMVCVLLCFCFAKMIHSSYQKTLQLLNIVRHWWTCSICFPFVNGLKKFGQKYNSCDLFTVRLKYLYLYF